MTICLKTGFQKIPSPLPADLLIFANGLANFMEKINISSQSLAQVRIFLAAAFLYFHIQVLKKACYI